MKLDAGKPAEAASLVIRDEAVHERDAPIISGEVVSPAVPTALPVQAASDDEAVQLWLRQYGDQTQKAYRRDLASLLGFVRKPLCRVTLTDAQDYAASLAEVDPANEGRPRLSPATQARRLAAMKSLMGFLHSIGYLAFDVGKPVRTPKLKDALAERILDEAQIRRMIDGEPSARNHALLTLIYWTGIRLSETCGLRWRDLKSTGKNGGGQATIFGKGDKTRVVILPPRLWRSISPLRRQGGPDDPVFVSREAGPLTPSQVQRIVKAAATRAGLPEAVSTHWLRHGHATHALAKGAPLTVLQRSMGHADPKTTMRYVHTTPGEGSATYFDT